MGEGPGPSKGHLVARAAPPPPGQTGPHGMSCPLCPPRASLCECLWPLALHSDGPCGRCRAGSLPLWCCGPWGCDGLLHWSHRACPSFLPDRPVTQEPRTSRRAGQEGRWSPKPTPHHPSMRPAWLLTWKYKPHTSQKHSKQTAMHPSSSSATATTQPRLALSLGNHLGPLTRMFAEPLERKLQTPKPFSPKCFTPKYFSTFPKNQNVPLNTCKPSAHLVWLGFVRYYYLMYRTYSNTPTSPQSVPLCLG